MKLYEFRFVGDDQSFTTQQLAQEPVPGETVTLDGVTYAVEGVDPTHWGQPTVVYLYYTDEL